MLDQRLCPRFAQVKNPLKTLCIAVIGVGDFCCGWVAQNVEKEFEFACVFGRANSFEIRKVVIVHGKNDVETLKVFGRDFSGSLAARIVASSR